MKRPWIAFAALAVFSVVALTWLLAENADLRRENARLRNDLETRKAIQDRIGRGLQMLPPDKKLPRR
jgi:hypothetical protein